MKPRSALDTRSGRRVMKMSTVTWPRFNCAPRHEGEDGDGAAHLDDFEVAFDGRQAIARQRAADDRHHCGHRDADQNGPTRIGHPAA